MEGYPPLTVRPHHNEGRSDPVGLDISDAAIIQEIAEALSGESLWSENADLLLDEAECYAPQGCPISAKIPFDFGSADVQLWKEAKEDSVPRIKSGQRLHIPRRRCGRSILPRSRP